MERELETLFDTVEGLQASIVDVHQFYNYIRMLDADDYENSFIKVGDFKLQLSRAKLCSDDSILADIKISKVKE